MSGHKKDDGRPSVVTKQSSDVTEGARTECSHTPGPWKASEENVGGGFNIYAGPLRVAHTSIQVRVFKPEQRPIEEAEAKANGLLIAAAPDLLEILESINAALYIDDNTGMWCLSNDWDASSLEAALSLVKGGERA